jgi:hypothetical protein
MPQSAFGARSLLQHLALGRLALGRSVVGRSVHCRCTYKLTWEECTVFYSLIKIRPDQNLLSIYPYLVIRAAIFSNQISLVNSVWQKLGYKCLCNIVPTYVNMAIWPDVYNYIDIGTMMPIHNRQCRGEDYIWFYSIFTLQRDYIFTINTDSGFVG